MYSMEIKVESCIRGHHMYSTIWTPLLGELLSCEENWIMPKNDYVVTVCRIDDIVVRHIPKKISFLWAVYTERGGTIQCIVSAIYNHIFPHLDFLLLHCKIVKRTLLFWRFPVTISTSLLTELKGT